MPVTQAQVARIPLNPKIGTPALDLVYKGNIISPFKAKQLFASDSVKLFTLDPYYDDSTLWKGAPLDIQSSVDDLAITEDQTVKFDKIIKSNSGFFKYNVINDQSEYITLYHDKKLHTTLLRKNMLRKLGFYIPGLKYIKNIKVSFKTKTEKEDFISAMRRNAEGRSSRWIVSESDTELELRDIVAEERGHNVPYNFAMGLNSAPINTRAERSLILPYAILDVKESVNKLLWTVGRLSEGNKIDLPHFIDNNDFATTTTDDLLWMANKLSELKRTDFEEIVKNAFYPKAVEKILIEKLIARTKSILDLLEIQYNKAEFSFNTKEHYPPYLLNGVINKVDWTDFGYASEFAGNPKDSPFKDFRYYIYAMFQSVGIDSLIARANQELKAFDPNDARLDLAQEEFERGLNHFVETGEFIDFPVSSWTSPVLNGNLILSRNIVVGNYLGTNNSVQLADTIGFAISLGALTGFENIDFADQVMLSATTNYVKTFTHLKPLETLKSVFEEDYRNIIVSMLKRKLRKKLIDVVESQPDDVDDTYLSNVVEDINKLLGVGESLIITEKLLPKLSGRAKIPLMNSGFNLGLGASYEHLKVARLQILRESANTIRIYDDKGYGNGLDFKITLENLIPIIRFEYKPFKGGYNVKSYSVNIQADKAKNPHFLDGITGISSILTSYSGELLDELTNENKSVSSSEIQTKFSDKYSKFAFLFWRRETNKGFSHFHIKSSWGLKDEYVTYHDNERTGLNWESFTKDIIQYGLSEWSQGDNVEWANQVWGNSAHSIKGSSSSVEGKYEAQIIDGEINKEFIKLSFREEGWSESRSDLIAILNEINTKFKRNMYSKEQLEQIYNLYMYDIDTAVYLYSNGVNIIKDLSKYDLALLANEIDLKKYKGKGCDEKRFKVYHVENNGKRYAIETCGSLRKALYHVNRCPKVQTYKEQSKCYLKVAKDLFKTLDFEQFSKLVGENNYFLEGEVNGFRINSEVLNDPITSNSYGRKHPRYPYGLLRNAQRSIGVQSGEMFGEWIREKK